MESLPHLPEELAILILERLPPASSRRFQSVCKSWHSIISAPGFLESSMLLPCKRRQTSLVIAEARGQDDPSYMVLESPTSLSPTKLEPLPPPPNIYFWSGIVEVVGSCRGIVCLWELISGRCVLWNPTTGVSRALPDIQFEVNDVRFSFTKGFGYYDGNFKVVKISKRFNSDDPIYVRAHIYELSLGFWREILPIGIDNDQFKFLYGIKYDLGCWRDGKMCSWMANYWEANRESRTAECIIFSFDMANDTFTSFSSVPMPCVNDGVGLLALNDLLALWCCHSIHPHSGEERTMDIWVMLQHGVVKSWAKLWTIRVGSEPHRTLQIWNGGLVMKKGSKEHLLWCDLSNSTRTIQTLPVLVSSLPWRSRSSLFTTDVCLKHALNL